eukprot:COSAG02_NODE_2051_length_10000_cov_2.340471_8_plen_47_part_00
MRKQRIKIAASALAPNCKTAEVGHELDCHSNTAFTFVAPRKAADSV